VPRDPIIDALVDEIDQALIALQTARSLLAELHRPAGADGSGPRGDAGAPSIRYSGMSVAEAAGALGVSEEHVRRLLRDGQLAGVAFGGRVGWRLPREEIEQVAALWAAQRRARDEARSRAQGRPKRGRRR